MFCVECGKEIPNGVKFCPDCGASQIAKITEEKTKKKEIVKKANRFYSTSDIPQLKKLTVSELKEKLNLRNLPTSGNKSELIRKLLRAPVEKKTTNTKSKKKIPKKGIDKKRRKRQPSYSHTKKTQIIVYIKFLILGLISVFIFSFILNLLIHSPFEGGYFHEDYDKNTTTNNIFEIDFHFYAAPAVFCSVIIIVFTSLMGAVLVSSGQDNVKKKSNEQSFALIYIASLLIPIAGIIIGANYLTNKNEQTREAGTSCLIIAILSILAYWFFIFYLFF